MEPSHRIPELSPEGRAAAQLLRREVAGEVSTTPLRRWLYSTDASSYRVVPEVVVVAASAGDLVAVAEGLRAVRPAGGGARRRLQRGRAGDRRRHRRRLFQAGPHPRDRRRRAQGARTARRGAGGAQRGCGAARTGVRPRHVDGRPGHHRRHGRQQLLRLTLDRVRRDQRQGPERRRRPRRRRVRPVRRLRRRRPGIRRAGPGGEEARGGARAGARAVPRAHRHRLSADSPLHLRLQPPGAARSRAEPRPAARRVRGHAGALHGARGAARPAPRATCGRGVLVRDAPRRSGGQRRHPRDGPLRGGVPRPRAAPPGAQPLPVPQRGGAAGRRRRRHAHGRVPGGRRRGARRPGAAALAGRLARRRPGRLAGAAAGAGRRRRAAARGPAAPHGRAGRGAARGLRRRHRCRAGAPGGLRRRPPAHPRRARHARQLHRPRVRRLSAPPSDAGPQDRGRGRGHGGPGR